MNIPTAEELLKNNFLLIENDKTCEAHTHLVVKQMIEFAKFHVQKALENAYNCGRFKGWTNSEDDNVHKELFIKNIMSRQSIK